MSDTDSLYRLSVTPAAFRPPRRITSWPDEQGPQTPGNDQRSSVDPKASRSTGHKNFVQGTKKLIDKYLSPRAPTAQMNVTPPGSSSFAPHASSSKAKGKRKVTSINQATMSDPPFKRKSTPEFEADFENTDQFLDLADPDFAEASRVSTSSNKKRKSAHSNAAPPAKRAKQRQRHIAYDKCKSEESRNDRDKHLARIQKNWSVPTEQWMPKPLWPSRTNTKRGKKITQRIDDPKDWNGRLLAELAYLSGITRNNPERAFGALQEAVLRNKRSGYRRQVHETDVRYAIATCEIDVSIAPELETVGAEAGDDVTPKELSDEATAGPDGDLTTQLLSPRSPTFVGDDHIVEQEPRLVAASQSHEVQPHKAVDGNAWDGYDEEMDRLQDLELEAEEKEAVAAVKRAQRKVRQQKRRIRELTRQHGRSQDSAISLRRAGVDG